MSSQTRLSYLIAGSLGSLMRRPILLSGCPDSLTYEEFTLRQTGLPTFPSLGPDAPECLPRPTHPNPPPSVAIWKTRCAQSDALFKFGQHRNLKKVFTDGTIRLSPASSFEDPSLNPAQRDAELTFTYQVPPSSLTTGFTDPLNGATHFIPPGQRFNYTVSTEDYLVFCLQLGDLGALRGV